MQIALILLYLPLVHFAAVTGLPLLQAAALIVLAAGIFYKGLKAKQWLLWLLLVGVSGAIALLALFDLTLYVIYLPPIVLPLLIWGMFFNTLLPGKTPLVTAIGERARGPLSREMKIYTRRVTILWSVLLLGMSLWSAWLAWLNSPLLWSLVTNCLNYVVIIVVFFGEFYYRKHHFKNHDHPSLIDYIKIVVSPENFKRTHV